MKSVFQEVTFVGDSDFARLQELSFWWSQNTDQKKFKANNSSQQEVVQAIGEEIRERARRAFYGGVL